METPPALFIYIPYCPSVCTYCDFNVYARREGQFDAYVAAVRSEITTVAAALPEPRLARSLALGGGTPSLLSSSQLAQLVHTVTLSFSLIEDAEWTLEVNPGTVSLEKLEAIRALGFNRLSLGVETFDDARLSALNRRHTTADSLEAIALARRAGFQNLNLDLIYGLPGQSLTEWADALERALALNTEHLSLYALQVEDRTVLKKQIELHRVPAPDPEVVADMYELAGERLGAAGYEHYEISNWARPGFQSRHNLTYWRNEPYLGFGAGAHSSWRGDRYENLRHPDRYIARASRRESVVDLRESIPIDMQMAETMFLGLRLAEGVSWARFASRFGHDARAVYREPIELLSGWGLLNADERGLRLSERGRLVSNQVLWRFLPDIRE